MTFWLLLGIVAGALVALSRRSSLPPLEARRWDAPAGQHRFEGHILEWTRKRLRESPASAREAFDALPLPYRRVFAARRLEAEVAEGGFEKLFNGPYGAIVGDAIEAMRAFAAEPHARMVEEALLANVRRLGRRRALARLSKSYLFLDGMSPLMLARARYIEREAGTFDSLLAGR